MRDVAYHCHHCGSTHEVEAIRHNLHLDQRPIASYPGSRPGRLGRWLLRRRLARDLAQALWHDSGAQLPVGLADGRSSRQPGLPSTRAIPHAAQPFVPRIAY